MNAFPVNVCVFADAKLKWDAPRELVSFAPLAALGGRAAAMTGLSMIIQPGATSERQDVLDQDACGGSRGERGPSASSADPCGVVAPHQARRLAAF